MSIWAIADIHLSISSPQKDMAVFGGNWVDYQTKLEKGWKEVVGAEDLVLVAGDISWALNLEEAKIDLEWLEKLPGKKVMIKGNHDYWFSSLNKVRSVLPPSCHVIQNDAFVWNGISIGGTRLWDTSEYTFYEFKEKEADREKIYERELQRLEMSLKAMQGDYKIVMTHYPPIGANLEETRASKLLEAYNVKKCVFGHLHNVKEGELPFGEKNGVSYVLVSGDHLNFKPLKIL